MRIDVVYCHPDHLFSRRVTLAEGASIRQALDASKVEHQFPELDLAGENKVGVFGQVRDLNAELRDGDRVEVYRKITCDPETVPRRDRSESGVEEDDDE